MTLAAINSAKQTTHNAPSIRICTFVILTLLLTLISCNRNKFEHDASGIFEASEVIMSAEASGKIEAFNITEGDLLTKGQYIGYIDSIQLYLRKLQLQGTRKAVNVRKPDIALQIAATKEQIAKAGLEKRRVENLFRDGAATQKQVDDADSQLKVLEQTLTAQINSLSTSVNSLTEESSTYEVQIAQVEDQLAKCKIINPIDGTVLNKYVETYEIAVPGKPLYKIADTKNMFLRVYLIADQLKKAEVGEKVTVYIALSGKEQKSYPGTITQISDKAEFTPKTIQTKDERQNLVYAVKVAVENTDGLIKIGMYGDVDFQP
ncbi:MAG: HlyD family efflux transporter periplasmic adaptor subunit [Candidatus Azobacteroides sp.]|nr:HlyD family efflux transporter periplasmic adaptor subunit [Candidatus Azobacteroides sp.]